MTEAEAVEALERTRSETSRTLRVGLFATAAAEILPPALRQVGRGPDLPGRADPARSVAAG
ncbi:hypothetical protein [Streptomyces puniciscabiei]|uniref:hypothetical protein n=1 Tax=Streptomyces puniciscabiei TaxID=164348 RepID=UPI0006EB31CC|nr:hypothetical protein [Streptomyces puniciscabiei]